MHTLFLLNPTAGKADCTRTLPQQIAAAAAGAGLAPEDYTIRVTTHAGHARELSRAAAAAAQKAGVELRIFTAGGDGTFNEALTGAHGFDKTAVGCLPYGSGNDFLRTYGTKEEFLDLDAQLAGGAVPIDLMRTSLGLSATICAAGPDAQVAYGIPKFRRIPLCGGEAAYALSIVQQLCGHIGRRVEYVIDGEVLTVDCLMCAVCNGRAYGGVHRAQGQPPGHCKAADAVQKRPALSKRPAHRGRKALLYLSPRKIGQPAGSRWPRADHCHRGRRVRSLQAGVGTGAAAGRPCAAAAACVSAFYREKDRREVTGTEVIAE